MANTHRLHVVNFDETLRENKKPNYARDIIRKVVNYDEKADEERVEVPHLTVKTKKKTKIPRTARNICSRSTSELFKTYRSCSKFLLKEQRLFSVLNILYLLPYVSYDLITHY